MFSTGRSIGPDGTLLGYRLRNTLSNNIAFGEGLCLPPPPEISPQLLQGDGSGFISFLPPPPAEISPELAQGGGLAFMRRLLDAPGSGYHLPPLEEHFRWLSHLQEFVDSVKVIELSFSADPLRTFDLPDDSSAVTELITGLDKRTFEHPGLLESTASELANALTSGWRHLRFRNISFGSSEARITEIEYLFRIGDALLKTFNKESVLENLALASILEALVEPVTETNRNAAMTPLGFLGGTVIGALFLMSGPLMIKGYEEYVLPHAFYNTNNRTRANGWEQFVLGAIPMLAYAGISILAFKSPVLAELFGAGFGMISAIPIMEGVNISAEMIGLDPSINSPRTFISTSFINSALMFASSRVAIWGASAASSSQAAIAALRGGAYLLSAGRAAGALLRGGVTGLAVAASAIVGTFLGRSLDHLLVGDFEHGGLDEINIIVDRLAEDGFSLAALNQGAREMGRRVAAEDSDGVHTFSDWYADWAYDCIHGLEHSSYAEHRGV